MCDVYATPLFGIREPFSSISHLTGALIFTALAVLLVRQARGNLLRAISVGVMAYVCIQTLVISGLYHMQWPGPNREFFLRLDVAGIFLVIAGSVTPVHVILFQGVERWAPLGVAWITAIGGMLLRIRYFDSLPPGAGTAIFLVFGWCTAVTAYIVWCRYGWKFVRLAILAGLSYTAGAVVLLLHRPMLIGGVVGPHEVWHLAVLAALAMHWRFVFQFASGVNLLESAEPAEAIATHDNLLPIPIPGSADGNRDAA